MATFSDDFTGTNDDPWDSGKWTTTEWGTALVDIQGNEGRAANTGTYNDGVTAEANSTTDVRDAAVLLSVDNVADNAGNQQFNVYLRATGALNTDVGTRGQPANAYNLHMRVENDTYNWWLYRRIADTNTDLSISANSRVNFNKFWVRMEVVDVADDVVIRVKAWSDGEAEPGSWDDQKTDTSPGILHGSTGILALRSYAGGSNEVDVRVDALEFNDLGSDYGKRIVG